MDTPVHIPVVIIAAMSAKSDLPGQDSLFWRLRFNSFIHFAWNRGINNGRIISGYVKYSSPQINSHSSHKDLLSNVNVCHVPSYQ